MNNKYAFTLYERAKTIGLLSTLTAFGRNLRFNIPLSKKICDTSIDDMELSVRASNGLKRSGIMTIGELVNTIMSEKGLETVRNLGKKSISEIKIKLLCFAYKDLTDNEKRTFWDKFLELNSEYKSCI